MIRQKVIDNYRDMVASLKTELKLAEAEVERLKKVYATTNDSWKKLQAENIKLRAVVEAARIFCRDISSPARLDKLFDALAELDQGEGADD